MRPIALFIGLTCATISFGQKLSDVDLLRFALLRRSEAGTSKPSPQLDILQKRFRSMPRKVRTSRLLGLRSSRKSAKINDERVWKTKRAEYEAITFVLAMDGYEPITMAKALLTPYRLEGDNGETYSEVPDPSGALLLYVQRKDLRLLREVLDANADGEYAMAMGPIIRRFLGDHPTDLVSAAKRYHRENILANLLSIEATYKEARSVRDKLKSIEKMSASLRIAAKDIRNGFVQSYNEAYASGKRDHLSP